MPAIPRPAATVVVLRPAAEAGAGFEVFLVRRRDQVAFMAGAYVFPGGRVDATDANAAGPEWCDGVDAAQTRFPDLAPADAVACHVAAVRELFEEAGVLLARDLAGRFVAPRGPGDRARLDADRDALHRGDRSLRAIVEREHLRLALDALAPLAHWVTPRSEPRRYDTRFFLTVLPDGQEPLHDTAESTASAWLTPAEALERCARDEILLPPPTWRTLADLSAFGAIEDVMAWAASRPIVRTEPRLVERTGAKMLVLPGDPLWPAPPERAMAGVTRFVLRDAVWKAQG